MESIIGLKGSDFVILASDTMLVKSIYFIKDNSSKIRKISRNCMIGVVGNEGDTLHFADFVASNISLYEIQNGYELNTKALCQFTRNHVVSNLRSKPKSRVGLLMAGYDSGTGPSLSFIDPNGAVQPLDYCGHGLANSICSSIFHMLWRPQLNFEQGYSIVLRCIREIQDRLVLNLRSFEIYIVDKDGVRKLEQINLEKKNVPLSINAPQPTNAQIHSLD